MLVINNLDEWTKDYFENPDNQEKCKKACQRYDRLLMQNVRKMMLSGEETIDLEEAKKNDPGKRLEKVQYEVMPSVTVDGKKGRLVINLLDQTASFEEK